MTTQSKLELLWPGKDTRPRLEPRILIEEEALSHRVGVLPVATHEQIELIDIAEASNPTPTFGNLLIHGDNLLALKALEAQYAGKVNCIYIDPPYNTGSAFEHYDDSVEHSTWLRLMRDRLESLRVLLAPAGFICCHIDDSEGHYLKVLLDEVFGRSNYLVTLYVQVRYAEKTLKQDMAFHKQIEQVHVYRKDQSAVPIQTVRPSSFEKFCFYVTELGPGRSATIGGREVRVFGAGEWKVERREGSESGLKEIWATGSILDGNSTGRFFRDYLAGRSADDGLGVLYKVPGIGDDGLGFRYITGPARSTATKGKYFQGVPLGRLEADAEAQTTPIENYYDLAGSFGNCRHEGGVDFRGGKKPEALLQIILRHFSRPGDLVLDSFGGSGTTGAVAHKMGRRWIMVELGDQCRTHIVPRLTRIIDGEDLTGDTSDANWKGGGEFKYVRLAPSLLKRDKWGNWVINPAYNAEMLSEAMCKHMGFVYRPSTEHFWMHGYSTESDFIYVTTGSLSHDQLRVISDEVGSDRSLLICCKAFKSDGGSFDNLTLKRIPRSVLNKCEWDNDDYSFSIDVLSSDEDQDEMIGESPDESPHD